VDIDNDKIDAAVLALLYLTLHDGARAWKGHNWEVLGRLHRDGMIFNPVGKAKSAMLTNEGLKRSEQLGSVGNFVCGAKIGRKDPLHGAPQSPDYSGCPS
jgi:hypothetical protein